MLYDDNKGVVEPLDETAFGKALAVRGKHIIQINDLTTADTAHRHKTAETVYSPVATFAKTSLKLNDWVANYNKTVSIFYTYAITSY